MLYILSWMSFWGYWKCPVNLTCYLQFCNNPCCFHNIWLYTWFHKDSSLEDNSKDPRMATQAFLGILCHDAVSLMAEMGLSMLYDDYSIDHSWIHASGADTTDSRNVANGQSNSCDYLQEDSLSMTAESRYRTVEQTSFRKPFFSFSEFCHVWSLGNN